MDCKKQNASAIVDCLCLGTGRFLRNVLVPMLNSAGLTPALIQTRGTSFVEYLRNQNDAFSYPIETVLPSGEIITDQVSCCAAFSLGTKAGKATTHDFIRSLSLDVKIIGIGVTEAGLASAKTSAMQNLLEIIQLIFYKAKENQRDDLKIIILNTDNVLNNGNVIHSHLKRLVTENTSTSEHHHLLSFISQNILCLNTMVDRITSARPDDSMVPRAEPMPRKALVVLDPNGDLSWFPPFPGLIIRRTQEEIDSDLGLKLRIANGTHTALAHAMALQGMVTTELLSYNQPLWIESYLESLIQHQILPASPYCMEESSSCWEDWKKRLIHPYFGLSTFFITQNGAAKAGIRWSGTVLDLVLKGIPIKVSMAFAYASLIRWLTPRENLGNGIYVGWLDGVGNATITREVGVEYGDSLRFNLEAGWYEFKCSCDFEGKSISDHLLQIATPEPRALYPIIREFLLYQQGGALGCISDTKELEVLTKAISILVARMLDGITNRELMMEIYYQQGIHEHGFNTDCSIIANEWLDKF
jgi:mannitol-1-phosphate/altronate dehydrogenase